MSVSRKGQANLLHRCAASTAFRLRSANALGTGCSFGAEPPAGRALCSCLGCCARHGLAACARLRAGSQLAAFCRPQLRKPLVAARRGCSLWTGLRD
eukprot:1161992-Pelagomonas_calceolata.AAC.14